MIVKHLGSDGRNFWGYAAINSEEIDYWNKSFLNWCLQTVGPDIWIFWGTFRQAENSTFHIKKGMYNNRFIHNMRRKIKTYTKPVWKPDEIKNYVEQQILVDTLKA